MMKLVVLSCVLAAACASVVSVAPFGYSAPFAYSAAYGYGAPFAYSAPFLTPYSGNYRGPLSLAPGQPANILGADGRPLDTLEVNLDKLEKAASGVHILKKRSVAPWIAPLAYNAAYGYGAPFGYAAPLAYSTPYLTPYSGNYRGPLSLAPGQPANILGADGRPLDTLEVNLDKLEKAASGVHILKKRSVAVAPLVTSHVVAPAPLITHTPFARLAPVSHISPFSPYASFATPYANYW